MIRSGTAIQALPSFLDKLVPAWGAILMSVTLILAFGEVIKHSWLVSASIPWSMISYMYFLYFITVGKVVMDGSIIDSPVKGLTLLESGFFA